MPKISVIMPVYNVEKYLRECVDSVLAQTMRDFELICVDDGSTDSSPSILDEYTIKDPRVKVVHRGHSNAGACRNAGLDMSSGKYLLFLDSDDVFSPGMLQVLHDVAEKTRAEIVSCRQVTYHDGAQLPMLDKRWTPDKVDVIDDPARRINVFSRFKGRAWDKLVRADFVKGEQIRFQEIRSTNDARFTYSALCLSKRIADMELALIAHRLHDDSLEATRSKGVGCMREMQLSFYEEMKKRGVFPACQKLLTDYRVWCLQVSFWYIDTIDGALAYEKAIDCLKKSADELSLYDLLDSDVSCAKSVKDVLTALKNDCTALEYAMLRNEQIHNETAPRTYHVTMSCRIGLLVTWLPRKAVSIWKKWRRRRLFLSKCKRMPK